MTLRIRSLLVLFIDLIMAVIAFFLGMRVIFQLFQANPSTPFVTWIYTVSAGLMYPFRGIFPNLQISEFGVLDLVALVTLLAYSVIGYLIIGAIRTMIRPTVHDAYHREQHLV